MTGRLFALERWAERSPRVRFPLLLLALLLLWGLAGGLSGCGGPIEAEPEPLPRSTGTAGDAHTGSAALVLALPGPPLQLAAPARVRVRLVGTLHQTAHYAAQASVAIALSAPVATGAAAVPVALGVQTPVPVPLAYDVTLQLPAGLHDLVARVVVRATDGDGLSTSALAVADVALDWRVEVQP